MKNLNKMRKITFILLGLWFAISVANAQDQTKLEEDGTITCTWSFSNDKKKGTIILEPASNPKIIFSDKLPDEPEDGYHNDLIVIYSEVSDHQGVPTLKAIVYGKVTKSMADPFDSNDVTTSKVSPLAGLPGSRIEISNLAKDEKEFHYYNKNWTAIDVENPAYIIVLENSIVGVNVKIAD